MADHRPGRNDGPDIPSSGSSADSRAQTGRSAVQPRHDAAHHAAHARDCIRCLSKAQIAVGLITLFGKTRNIAEVSALGRLGQVFMIFNAFNSVMIEPHVARLPRSMVARRYVQIALCGCTVAAVVTTASFLLPGPLLLLLGHAYRNLRSDVGWVVAATCVSYVAGVLWIMNGARKFLYWWYTGAYIVVILLSQVLCVLYLDLSSTRNVIYFMLITNAATLIVHAAAGGYGIARTRREPLQETPPVAVATV